MEKINKKWIVMVIMAIICLPALISFLCNLADYIPLNIVNVGTNSDWISFWGSMLGAIFGVIGTYLVLQIQIRNESERFEQTQIDNTFFNMLDLFQKVQGDVREKEYFITVPGINENDFREGNKEVKVDIFDKILDEIKIKKNSFLSTKDSEYAQKLFEETKPEIKLKIKMDLQEFLEVIKEVDYSNPWYQVKLALLNVLASLEGGGFHEFHFYMNSLLSSLNSYETWINEQGERLISPAKELDEYIFNTAWKCKYGWHEQEISKIVDEVFSDYHSDLGNYLRILHRLIKHIMNSNLDMNKKKEYLGIIRALLSSRELLIVFYNTFYSSRGAGLREQLRIKDKKNQKTEFFADKLDLLKFNVNEENGMIDLPFFEYKTLIFKESDFSHIKELAND